MLSTACSQQAPASLYCIPGYEKLKAGQYVQARELLTRCVNSAAISDSNRRNGYLDRAMANDSLGEHQAAVRDQEAAFAINGEKAYGELINYTLYLRQAGRLEDSLGAIQQAQRMDQEEGVVTMPVQYHLGWTLQALGRHQEAVEAFTVGLPAQPDFAAVYYRRGVSYEVLGQQGKAREDFKRVSQLLQTPSRGNTGESGEQLFRDKLKEYGL